MKIVLATFNQDKLREMRELLRLPGLTLTALCDVPGATAPAEGGDSLEQNARLKARAALDLAGMPAIADDTGLEVDALGGRPGIHAARYAGPGATYADNVAKLLAELANVSVEQRAARFRTVCVALFPDGTEVVAEGVLVGRIALEPRGENGFGYDPVFEVLPLGRTLAEMGDREKNALSHRGRAARALARQLADRAAPR